MESNRLKVAVQKKGRLSDGSLKLLERCGVEFFRSKDKLLTHSSNMALDLLFMRDDDIPGLVMDGVVDLGFVGENVLFESQLKREARESASDFKIIKKLDFGYCRLALAVDRESDYKGLSDISGSTVATTYPYLVSKFLTEKNIECSIIKLSGSVEVAPRAGLAAVVADLVSTGTTLEANGLTEVETILDSNAVIVQRVGEIENEKTDLINRLLARIQGVTSAKESKYIMLHAPVDKLDEIKQLLPGAEDPTILDLASTPDKVAMHLVCSENLFWETMEMLKELGATSILVLPIEKMLE